MVQGENGDKRARGIMLQGDNLQFLSMVGTDLTGKVRLIYMDPPYNTGNKNHAYKDRYERDEWLSFIEERLKLALPLLTDDGSICISIDDSEMPYLRVLLDGMMGEDNFVACVAYERSGSAGLGQGGVILNTKEYILIYSRDKRRLNAVGYERKLDLSMMKRYNRVLLECGKQELVDEFESSGNMARLYKYNYNRMMTLSLRDFHDRRPEIEAQYISHFDKIFRTQNVQKENTFQNRIIAQLHKDFLYSLDYVPSRGRYKGQNKTLYYWNGELCAWLKDSSSIVDGEIIKRNKLTDFWSHGEIPKADLANEGGVLFSRSKKPEHLLYRLIALASDPNDLVLDFFLGSGTTAAVAHKMERQWIGVENGDFFEETPLARLKNVVEGDPTGVSKLVAWKGGGSFAFGGLA